MWKGKISFIDEKKLLKIVYNYKEFRDNTQECYSSLTVNALGVSLVTKLPLPLLLLLLPPFLEEVEGVGSKVLSSS